MHIIYVNTITLLLGVQHKIIKDCQQTKIMISPWSNQIKDKKQN